MVKHWKGKYTKQNFNRPRGLATCDYSGLLYRYEDGVKQYQYRGNTEAFTGNWVNPVYADKLNPVELAPIIRLDPIPFKHPRPDPIVYDDNLTQTNIDLTGLVNPLLTVSQLNVNTVIFSGTLAADIFVFIPNTYLEFYANNVTTGNFTLNLEVEGTPYPGLVIPLLGANQQYGPLVNNNTLQLTFINYQR